MSTFDDERRMQTLVDKYYQHSGYLIDRSVSCKNYDVALSINGDKFLVEEKFNFTDRKYKQMIVELIQDAETGDLGWFYHVKCDVLFWYYCPEDRKTSPRNLYVIGWKRFKPFVIEKMNGWVSHHYNRLGYGLTLNIPINLDDVLNNKIGYKSPEFEVWK